MPAITVIAACGAVSMPVSMNGKSHDSIRLDSFCPTSWPPSSVPMMIEPTVSPSIQPFALTRASDGSSSVRMPYLAGE